MTGNYESENWPLNQEVYANALKYATEQSKVKTTTEKVTKTGAKKTHTIWSRKDRTHLKKYANVKTVKQLAKELGKTEVAISSMIYKMRKGDKNFSNVSRWTLDEDRFLLNNYSTMTKNAIGKKLGRSGTAVQIRLGILLKKSKGKSPNKQEDKSSNVEQLKFKFENPEEAKIIEDEIKVVETAGVIARDIDLAEKISSETHAVIEDIVEPSIEVEKAPITVEVKKEFNKVQAFLLGLTILNTIILSWILFSSFIQ